MTPEIVAERLTKLLQKLSLPKPITVDDVKEIIWNAKKSSGSSELFFRLTEQEKDQATIDETIHLVQDAWNYFPHRVLGGKSPYDLVTEYQQTGKIDQKTQTPLPKQGKSLHDVFASQYPETVIFEKLSDDTWGFGFPKLYHELTEQLWDLEETHISVNVFEKELHRMLKLMPELFDAVNDLAHLYGKKNEPGIAKTLYEQAITNARRYISKTFIPGRDRAIWAYLENRPFLRMMAGYAIFVEQYEGIRKAIPLYEEILSFNPNDNQGIRALLATGYLKTAQPEKIIKLTSRYPNDSTPDIVMGKLLALLKLKKMTEAKKYLNKIKDYQLHVIKELLKPSHPKPATIIEDRVRLGGEDEAYFYWQSQGNLWQTTDGALEFLAEHTKDIQAQIITVTDKEVLAVDFFHDFLTFLARLKERPIKRTATGNISIKDIEQLLKTLKTVQPIFQHAADLGWKVRTEDDIQPLHLCKILADIMHLTYKRRDKLLLAKNGQAFLRKLSPIEQYNQLVQYYWHQFNWAYFAGFTEKQETLAHVLQENQDHVWRILAEKGTEWIDYKTFCKSLRDALHLQPYLEEAYSNPENILYRRIDHILFSSNLLLFGCVEVEEKQGNDKWETIIARFRSTKIGLSLY